MDFQENRQTDAQEVIPTGQPSSPAESASPSQPEQPGQNNDASSYQNRPPYGNGTPYPMPRQPGQNQNSSMPQNYQNRNGSIQPPYGNGQGAPRQNTGGPYRNNMPYGSPYPDRNQNPYPGGNQNQYPGGYRSGSPYQQQNGYNNGYPYYGRGAYQLPVSEPGSSFAKAAMICGSLSIFFGFILPVYPTFTLACVAIVLALLSRGRQPKLLSHARIGIICAVVGLVLNIIVIISSVVPVLTNPEAREEFNQSWEAIWGESFEDTLDDIMENNGYE